MGLLEQIQNLAHATPFEPFCLVLPDGSKMKIPHPDYIWIPPNKRAVVVSVKNVFKILNLNLIVAIETKSAA